MEKILVINGHPDRESFGFDLAVSYKKGAESAGADCKIINLIDLEFNPILTYGYRKVSELEPDLLQTQRDILDAAHLVFVYPILVGNLSSFVKRIY